MVIKHWPMGQTGSLKELINKIGNKKVRRIVVNWETPNGHLAWAREEYFGITKLFKDRYMAKSWFYGAIGDNYKATLYIYF